MKNLLFLYLDTGNGHLAPARVVKRDIEDRYAGAVHVDLLNGFGPRQFFSRLFFEKGYYFACNYLSAAFSAMYDMVQNPLMLRVAAKLVTWRTTKFIESCISSRSINAIVSFHFALVPASVRASRNLYGRGMISRPVPVIVVVTDPFTAPRVWFLEKNVYYIVFSEDVKRTAVRENGVPPDRVLVQPFILDRKFVPGNNPSAVSALKRKYGFDDSRRLVLIAGGGNGLPGVVPLVKEFLARKPGFSIAVVCGHNERSRKRLERDAGRVPESDVKIFGFVPFMDDLIAIADCVITKAGASTVMEILACRKPVIFSTFIHGQEQGNVSFVTSRGAGWFLRSPRAICEHLRRLFSDSELYARTMRSLDAVNVRPDTRAIVDFIAQRAGVLPVSAETVAAAASPGHECQDNLCRKTQYVDAQCPKTEAAEIVYAAQ